MPLTYAEMAEMAAKDVLKVLMDSRVPVKKKDIMRATGLEMLAVEAGISKLRKDGVKVKYVHSPFDGGYYLEHLYTPPPPKRRDPANMQLYRLAHSGKAGYGGIELMRYPVDWAMVKSIADFRGMTITEVGRAIRKRFGDEGTARTARETAFLGITSWSGGQIQRKQTNPRHWQNKIARKLYAVERGEHETFAHREAMWPIIAVIADVLEVPAEMLIDEEYMMFGNGEHRPGMPKVYAGHKLLFSAVRKGYHPLDLIPPFWKVDSEEVKADTVTHSKYVLMMKHIYKGRYRGGWSINSLLHVCEMAGVTLAELFSPFRRRGVGPHSFMHDYIAALDSADAALVSGVIKLLGRRDVVLSPEFVKSALSRLVDKWSEIKGRDSGTRGKGKELKLDACAGR